jgi:hypothetical protein
MLPHANTPKAPAKNTCNEQAALTGGDEIFYHAYIWLYDVGTVTRTWSGMLLVVPALLPAVRSMTLPMIVGKAMLVPDETKSAIIAVTILPDSGLAAAIRRFSVPFFTLIRFTSLTPLVAPAAMFWETPTVSATTDCSFLCRSIAGE